jgi:hypothetical protein
MDDLRIGWDLILDIDTKFLEYAKACAKLLCLALEFHGIKNYSIKYSGGSGFHIGIPFESFPDNINGVETRRLFPEAAQTIAAYLREMIKDKLRDTILSINSLETISEKTGKPMSEFLVSEEFDPYSVIEIDTIAISPRHLVRMPYSINEKKNRVSVPISKEELDDFDSENAKISNVVYTKPFLASGVPGEARELFVQAFDWHNKELIKKETNKKKKNFDKSTWTKTYYKIPKRDYPPCIKLILKGLEDSKKRALFILINYFKSANYSFEEIESIISEWNKKNNEPLRDSYVKSQLIWSKKNPNNYLPPNCNSLMYYKDIRVCVKDEICESIKNPLNYSFKSYKRHGKIKKE